MVNYRLRTDTLISEGIETVTYGIEAVDENGRVISLTKDISPIREKTEYLLEKIIRLNLAPYQLKDVAEDYIISDNY